MDEDVIRLRRAKDVVEELGVLVRSGGGPEGVCRLDGRETLVEETLRVVRPCPGRRKECQFRLG